MKDKDSHSSIEKVESASLREVVEETPSITARDAKFEARIWRKCDLIILPVLTMLYFLSFLDRANIANARIAGLQKDLKMTNHQYSIVLTVTYIPYIAAELPSNLVLKYVGPDRLLPSMVAAWGVITIAQGFVTNYHGLLACRFLLGLCEGGLLPGIVLYLSFFYPRRQLQWRISAFFSASAVSGAFSGLLAYGIVNMNGLGGRPGWAWIFILEGLFTTVFGVASLWMLPRSLAASRFLTQEQKDHVTTCLRRDKTVSANASVESFSWKEVRRAFTSPHVWVMSIMLFLSGTLLYGMAYFTPSIVQGLGYRGSRAQLMSVPPFVAAFVVAMSGSYISDRYQCRGIVNLFADALCIIGFAVFLTSTDYKKQYGALFFILPGTYLTAPTVSAWMANNVAPHTRRATAIALGYMMASAGGILVTWLLGTLSAAPRYTLATRVFLAFSVILFGGSIFISWYFWDQNKRKDRKRAGMTSEGHVEEDMSLGNRSVAFRYAY